MKKQLFLLLFHFITLIIFSSCNEEKAKPYGLISIRKDHQGYSIYKGNNRIKIQGASGYTHLAELKKSGGNTIRTWDTTHLERVLDSAQKYGLYVMAGFPMPDCKALDFYSDTASVTKQRKAFRAIVKKYRKHPSLLVWCLGNELDFPYKPNFSPFYNAFNSLLEMVKEEDPDHPVTTTLANFHRRPIINIKYKVPNLDFISFNSFGKIQHLEQELEEFSWFWDGPFLISEWGINGPWEEDSTAWGAPIENTSTKKAEQYSTIYKNNPSFKNKRCLGSMVFYWGQKQEKTHTWFSLFSQNGASSQVVESIRNFWSEKKDSPKSPQVKYMLVNGKGAKDNIILEALSLSHSAEILFENTPSGHLKYKWEILHEDYWHERYWKNTKKPKPLQGLLLSESKNRISFKAPSEEGPYRLFVEVYDTNGTFATANTPFYVVE